MAIMGFLVHVMPELSAHVEQELGRMPEITTYGVHQENHIVAVAEAPRTELETLMHRVRRMDGVINTYVTSLTVEDEQPDAETGERKDC